MSVYLDYNASAPINEQVLEKMVDVYKNYIGNADSRTHDYGTAASTIVTEARQNVANMLGVRKDEVFFTSGATESNNIAIQGLKKYALEHNKKHIITTSFEHKSVLNTVKAMESEGFEVDYVDPESSGRVDAQKVLNLVRDDTLLVSIMHVNNETGIIQPIQEIGDALENKNVFFHCDATQSAGKLIDELREVKYDMLSFSAHKLQGPQGIGALILKKKHYRLPPVQGIMYGGSQEHGIRPGTTPVALVAGLGEACRIAIDHYQEKVEKARSIKAMIIELLNQSNINYSINGDQDYCVPTTLNICFKGVNSEALMLSSKQYVSISNGSACTSHDYQPSYVLQAMGMSVDDINNSIRVSWGYDNDLNEIKEDFINFLKIAKQLA